MSQKSYLPRKSRLLKDFDRSLARVKNVLFARFGEGEAAALMRESRRLYENLIPQIPYIGDRNPFLIFLLPTTRYLAIYRAFKNHGRTVGEVGQLISEISEAELHAIPGWLRRVIGVLWFSPLLTRRIQRRASFSHKREYAGDYVLDFVAGGQDFDWGVDYIECASCKFLDQQSAGELKPDICAVDIVASEMLGWGLRRTMTLAEGNEKCDFRFKKGGKTYVPLPRQMI